MIELSGIDAAPGGDHAVPAIQAAFLVRLRKRHLLPLCQGLLQCCPTLLRALLYSTTLSVTGSSVSGTGRHLQPDCYKLLQSYSRLPRTLLHASVLSTPQIPLYCEQVKAYSKAQAL